MLHLLLGKDWVANRNEILQRIRKDVMEQKENRILLVPELVSHETERLICEYAGDTASRFAEVLSFTRLGRRVADYMGCAAEQSLDAGGRVVAMAAAARQMHSRLKAYANMETRPEFLTGLVDAVDEFKRCCISSQDLMVASETAEGSFAQKLEELSLLLEGYNALCGQGKRDPRDQETLLLEQMEMGDFAQSHVFYIDGFPDFTRQHLAILTHLIQHSPEVTVSLNCDCVDSAQLAFEKAGDTAAQILRAARNAGVEVEIQILHTPQTALSYVRERLFQGRLEAACSTEHLQVFCAASPYLECLAAAEQIIKLVKDGNRYRDISVVCADLPGYQSLVSLAFHRCAIPMYLSGTEDILQKSVIATVLAAIDTALGGFEQRSVLRYLRSVLSPVDPDICDRMENYAVIWGIRGNKWAEKWENHPDGLSAVWDEESRNELEILNQERERAITPLLELQRSFRNAQNMQQQIIALYGFLEAIDLQDHLQDLADRMDASGDNRSAQILNQLWEILMGAMEQLYDVLGNTVWDSDTFTRLFQLLLSQYDVGTIPPVLDAVHVGAVSSQRLHQHKHLIILGAMEGNLPGYTGTSGVLTDQERAALRELGVPLTGGNMEGIQAEFAEIYGVFCGATESVSVYYSGEHPSFVCRRLAEMAGGERQVTSEFGPALSDPVDAAAYLAYWDASEEADILGVADAFNGICGKKNYVMGSVTREHIDTLYGKTLNLSASQIDRQAECRMSYFLKYGLRAKERKEATVDPAEFGTYVHAVLENTARCVKDMGGFSRVTLEETLDIARRFSDEYAKDHFAALDSQRLAYLFRRNAQELEMVVRELWEELQKSGFQPVGFEVNFGSADGLPPIAIPGATKNAILRGFVDRVDTWFSGTNTYYRVVDYKTGKKDFDYCDVFNGVGLQMLLYLFALQETGEEILGNHPIPAGVQYFPARIPYVSADGTLTEAELEKSRGKDRKRKGLLLKDTDVLHAMEPGDMPKLLSYQVKKDGSIDGDVADREQLRQLKEHIFNVLKKMVDDIASGNVEPNPYTRGSSHSACAFCPYGTVCHKAEVENIRNYKTMTAQRFWEEIGKGENGHG